MTLHEETFTAGKSGFHVYIDNNNKLNFNFKIFCKDSADSASYPTTLLANCHTFINLKTVHLSPLISTLEYSPPVAYQGGGLGDSTPPRNSEVLAKLSRIPSSVENTYVTT